MARTAGYGFRLASLGEAQSLLIEGEVTSASIREVVTSAVRPHYLGDRCTIIGSAYQLEAKRALALSLAVHELATNAIKYEAFSIDAGTVCVEWRIEDGELVWIWGESGAPTVHAPARARFGSRIITRNLAGQFRGTVDLQHPSNPHH